MSTIDGIFRGGNPENAITTPCALELFSAIADRWTRGQIPKKTLRSCGVSTSVRLSWWLSDKPVREAQNSIPVVNPEAEAVMSTRTEARPPVELWTITSLLMVALLTFFFPLLTIQIPLLGTQYVSGYDIFSKTRQFEKQLSSISKGSKKPTPGEGEGQQSDQPSPTLSIRQNPEHPFPLSVQFAPLVPIEVTLAFVSCLVALLASRWGTGTSKVAATVGAVSALSATIHVIILNAELHTWFQESMQFPARGNFFAGFAQQLGKILASRLQITPGVGLYVLAVALVLVTIAYHSRLLARLRLDEPSCDDKSH